MRTLCLRAGAPRETHRQKTWSKIATDQRRQNQLSIAFRQATSPAALTDALQFALSLPSSTLGQQIAQRQITTSLEDAMEARRQRILVSRSEVNATKWTCLISWRDVNDKPSFTIIDSASDPGGVCNDDCWGSTASAVWVLDGATGLSKERLFPAAPDGHRLVFAAQITAAARTGRPLSISDCGRKDDAPVRGSLSKAAAVRIYLARGFLPREMKAC